MFRSRAFCFTLNNYTDVDVDALMDISFEYLCFGFEEAPVTGTPHIQGYIYMHSVKTLIQMNELLKRAHFEHAKGTRQQNDVYTSKLDGDDWYSFGDVPEQGRIAWEKIEDVMADPTSNPHVYNQYNKMYKQLVTNIKKDHVRELYIISSDHKYDYAKLHNTVCLTGEMDVYDNEDAFMCSTYDLKYVDDWINGFPPKFKRGYELITFDPRVIYLMYDDENQCSRLRRMYIDQCNGFFVSGPIVEEIKEI